MQDESSIHPNEDAGLMAKAQEGDRQAYAQLYERYVPRVRGYMAARIGPAEYREDLVQEVFTRVWEHRDRYRPGMAVGPYLLGFAKNVHREHRVLARREIPLESQEPNSRSVDQGPETIARRNDQAERVRRHLAQLPPRQRQALELVYLGGLSSREVSRLLGCSDHTVRVNCRIGLQKLKRLLRVKPTNE